MPDSNKLHPQQWLGRPILSPEHVQDLETRAAVNEFHHHAPRQEAEQRAHDDYVKEHRERAAAHHLTGMKAAMATGNHQDARKHWTMYDLHLKALGKDSIGAVPPEIEKRIMDEHGDKPVYKFKAHKGDLFALHEPTKDTAPAEGQPVQKAEEVEEPFELKKGEVVPLFGQKGPGKGNLHDQHVNAGFEAHRSGNLEQARHHYMAAIQANPQSDTALYNLGVVHEDLGAPREAREAYKHAVAINAQNGDAHYNLARLYAKAGMPVRASKHMKAAQSLGVTPDSPDEPVTKAEAKQCKWRLGERRCQRMVTGGYCHDHKDHWANKIKQKEAQETPIEKAFGYEPPEDSHGEWHHCKSGCGAFKVDRRDGKAKDGSPKCPRCHGSTEPHDWESASHDGHKVQPQRALLDAHAGGGKTSAPSTGHLKVVKAELGHIQKPCPLCGEKQKNLSHHLDSAHEFEMEHRRKDPDDPVVNELKGIKKEELLTKPPVSEAQRRAMEAAAHGNSTLGIPKKVGKEFADADAGGKLPEHKKAEIPPTGTSHLQAPQLHSTVEGFVGGLKTLPKGSPERGKFLTAHMNHAPFLSALAAHPQGKQVHQMLTGHLNSAANAGFKPGATQVMAKAEAVASARALLKGVLDLLKGQLVKFPGNQAKVEELPALVQLVKALTEE